MTDLIPRDAVISAVTEMIDQANRRSLSSVAVIAMSCRQNICAIPAIDPAAIREAALNEAAELVKNMSRVVIHNDEDLGQLIGRTLVDPRKAANAILALIGEKK